MVLTNKTGIVVPDKMQFLQDPKDVLHSKKEHQYMFLIKDLINSVDFLMNNKDEYSFYAADIDDTIINIGLYQNHVDSANLLELILRQNESRGNDPRLNEFIMFSAQEFIAELCKSQSGANIANKIWEKFCPPNIPKPHLLKLSESPRVRRTDVAKKINKKSNP